jgi:sugar (pentulose or hexulose) kinase
MKHELLIGLDVGTTALKAAALDRRTGRLLHGAVRRLPVELTPDGGRVTPVQALLSGLRGALAELRRRCGPRWHDVRGLGLAAQGGSMTVLSGEDNRPLTPMILWNDALAYGYLPQVMRGRPPRYWRGFTLRDEPGMGLARLEWLRATRPGLLASGLRYAGAGDLLYHYLTGLWRQDGCNALQAGIYDATRHRLTGRALPPDVKLKAFSPLRPAGDSRALLTPEAARALGLAPGIPVAGPYNDHEAGYLAVSQAVPQPLQCSLGTAWVGNYALPEDRRSHSPVQLVVASPAGAGSLAIQPLLTGNVAWDWMLGHLADPNPKRALAKQEAWFRERLLPPEGMTALNWFNRPNPLESACLGGGGFMGVGPTAAREDFIRAFALSMVCEFRRVFAAPCAEGLVSRLVLCGGGSNGYGFRQMFAALFHPLPVSIALEGDWMGARGSLHDFATPASGAACRPVKPARGVAPDALKRAYEVYLHAFEAVCGRHAIGAPVSLRPGGKP